MRFIQNKNKKKYYFNYYRIQDYPFFFVLNFYVYELAYNNVHLHIVVIIYLRNKIIYHFLFDFNNIYLFLNFI